MHDLVVIVCLTFDLRAPAAEVTAFKNCICNCPFVVNAMEVTGSYDLIVRGHCASLTEYQQNLEGIRPQIARLVSRFEANFLSSELNREPSTEDERCLWLPCDGSRKRVAANQVDKIIAEGDYMRVHVGTWNCLIHHTLKKLWTELGHTNFVQLHRSVLVRVDFIERFVHVERHWNARLRDGTTIRVAKGHVQDVLRLIKPESAKSDPSLPKRVSTEVRHDLVFDQSS